MQWRPSGEVRMQFDAPPRPMGLTLDPLAQAVSAARRFVVDSLPALDGVDVQDNATLAVSELVTNATLHARTPMTIAVERTAAGPIRISVRDHSALSPQPRAYALTATTGRGLRLVEAVSSSWGVDAVRPEDEPGKVVWCEPVPDADPVATAENDWADGIAELR